VNPREQLHTPGDVGYHKNQVEPEEVDEVYQDDEMSCSFIIDPNSALESLLNDANDVTVPDERVQELSNKKKYKIFNVLDISYYVLCIIYNILDISYYFLLFHMTFLIFHIMFLLYTHLCLFSIGCRKN
jgi:uncharacterized membrane protein